MLFGLAKNFSIGVNAFDYMVLARMIHFFVPSKRIWKIKPSILAFVFVALDIVSFIIQLIGGGMAGPGQSPEAVQRGVNIYMGGIGLQEFFVVIFFGLAITFHLEMVRAEKSGIFTGPNKAKWRGLLFALYASLIAISARIIFRLIEFSRGTTESNPILTKEFYLYIFDGIPMFIAIVLWNLVHPGSILQGPDSVLPRSWLSRKLCCCCNRRKQSHEKLRSYGSGEELTALRSGDLSSRKLGSESGRPDIRYEPHSQVVGYTPPHMPDE